MNESERECSVGDEFELALHLQHPAAAACAASGGAAPPQRTAHSPGWPPAGPCELQPPAGPPLQCWPPPHLLERALLQTLPIDTAAPVDMIEQMLFPNGAG